MADDPLPEVCVRAGRLRKAYDDALLGRSAQEVEQKAGDSGRRVKFQPQTAAQLAALKRELDEAEAACAAAQGLPRLRRRFAIGSTTMRRC